MKWVRTVLAGIVGVIAVVALLLSVIGFWACDTIFDESEVAGAVESALDEPGVTDALAVRLTDTRDVGGRSRVDPQQRAATSAATPDADDSSEAPRSWWSNV